MTGTFAWTYQAGEFENGVGQFSALSIPYTWHDQTDLDANINPTESIEITLPISTHDDGVVNFSDVALWVPFFNTATTGDADFNGDGFANFSDYLLISSFFLNAPGPSGLSL